MERYVKTQLSGFLDYYVDVDYMFRPLCWVIIRSQEVQARSLYRVQILAMVHHFIKCNGVSFFLSYALQLLYILESNLG